MSTFEGDGRGNYSAELPEGAYDLLVSAQGYLSLLLRGIGVLGGYQQTLTRGLVPAGAHGTEPEGAPATALGGYVTDRLDRAMGGVIVHAQAAATAGVRDFGAGTGQAYTGRTEPSGAYVVHGVLPGTYDLAFRVGERSVHAERVVIDTIKSFVRIDAKIVNLTF